MLLNADIARYFVLFDRRCHFSNNCRIVELHCSTALQWLQYATTTTTNILLIVRRIANRCATVSTMHFSTSRATCYK